VDVSVLARHVDCRASGIEDRHALDDDDLVGLIRREVVLHAVQRGAGVRTTSGDMDDVVIRHQDRHAQLAGRGLVTQHVRSAHLEMRRPRSRSRPTVVRIQCSPQVSRHVHTAPDQDPDPRPHQPRDMVCRYAGVQRLPTCDQSTLAVDCARKRGMSVVPQHPTTLDRPSLRDMARLVSCG
jgi:hypothetical protein